jgi:hypothetical protein
VPAIGAWLAHVLQRLRQATVPIWAVLLVGIVVFLLTLALLRATAPLRQHAAAVESYGVLGERKECTPGRVYAGICDDGWLTYRMELVNPCEGHGLAKVWLKCPEPGNDW